MTWDVDGVRVTRVVELVMPFELDFFPEATLADITAEPWLAPDFIDARGRYLMSIHTFVVETDGRRIVVDTCSGNEKDRPLIPEFHQQNRPFLAKLVAAGFAPDTIDTVVCTHLHLDHVGWNTHRVDGRWMPTFPRARHLFAAADIDYWAHSDDPLHAPAFADSVQPVIDAGLVQPLTAETELAPDVRARPTPGHTPGHLSVWIGDRCVITGDVLHHPIQCCHPEWTGRGDCDPETARITRRELLAASAATGALMLGTHFAGTSAGRVVATEAATPSNPKPLGDLAFAAPPRRRAKRGPERSAPAPATSAPCLPPPTAPPPTASSPRPTPDPTGSVLATAEAHAPPQGRAVSPVPWSPDVSELSAGLVAGTAT